MSPLWSSIWLSLRIALVATSVAALIAVPLSAFMSRAKFRGRALVESLILLPLVLPPTVLGYLILVVFGSRGWVGRFLRDTFDYSIVFRFEGAVLAAAVVALPMLYLPSKAAFAAVEPEMEDIARLFGAGRLSVFWHVSLPIARGGILAGVVLAAARALGEFGATLMVFGWQPGQLTLPISIYAHYEQGEMHLAAPAVIALMILSAGLLLLGNHLSRTGR